MPKRISRRVYRKLMSSVSRGVKTIGKPSVKLEKINTRLFLSVFELLHYFPSYEERHVLPQGIF